MLARQPPDAPPPLPPPSVPQHAGSQAYALPLPELNDSLQRGRGQAAPHGAAASRRADGDAYAKRDVLSRLVEDCEGLLSGLITTLAVRPPPLAA